MGKIGKSGGGSIKLLKRPIIRTLRMSDDDLEFVDFHGEFRYMNTKTRKYHSLEGDFYNIETTELTSDENKKDLGVNFLKDLFISVDEGNITQEIEKER